MRVIDIIIASLQNLGGNASLNEIYDEVQKFRSIPTPSIRARLYEHASECDAYKKNNPDVFESTEGKGSGKWKFKQKEIKGQTSWLDEIINFSFFEVGSTYTRKKIREIANLSPQSNEREPWTGIVRLANAVLLFVNLDKSNTRANLQFNDWFDGSDFFWESRNNDTIETPHIKCILDGAPVCLFCRLTEKGKFVYAGRLGLIDHDENHSPIQFLFEVLEYDEHPNNDLKSVYDWKPGKRAKLPKIASKTSLKKRKSNGGQGFLRDAKKKEAIELRAMELAKKYYSNKGYHYEDLSPFRNYGYDLKCTKVDEIIDVEVKGTTNKCESVFLTKNEVENAKTTQNKSELFIAHSMEIELSSAGYQIVNQEIKVIENWRPQDEDLEALTYKYSINSKHGGKTGEELKAEGK